MKKLISLGLSTLCLGTSVGFSQAATAPHYTPEQVAVCAPTLLHGSDGDAKKSHHGKSVTASAIVTIAAEPGHMLDAREGQVVYTQSGTHLNRPGIPAVTKRVSNLFPVEMTLKSQAHRGTSLRFGRNAAAYNALAVYQVRLTPECIAALGLFDH